MPNYLNIADSDFMFSNFVLNILIIKILMRLKRQTADNVKAFVPCRLIWPGYE